ncbi:MAG TPA: hypothetical protein PLB11_03130 [Flavobacterium sp.]|nr:hypothetical protein [Flavobacterium sp.]
MEQNKLETQFKEKLNSREIKPSEMAWDRLNAMLSVAELNDTQQENQKTKSKFTWLYIAASFIGFLLISTVFFKAKENTINIKKNTVVIENSNPKESSKVEIKSIKAESNVSQTKVKSDSNPLVQTQKDTKSNVEIPIFKTQENAVAEIQPNNQNLQVDENKNISHENMESLLASAEKNSKTDRKNSSIKINSTDLLQQVDGELEVSFREKALNTITKKYKEAKEAFANRNNQ